MGFDSLRFSFVNLKGETVRGRWLDSYMGLFILDGSDGFVTVRQWRNMFGDALPIQYRIIYHSPRLKKGTKNYKPEFKP